MKQFDIGLMIGGVAVVGTFLAALATDINNIDPTQGGYEPPYSNYSGEPIDWYSLERTDSGLLQQGYVLDTHVDGTSGMISFRLLGFEWDYRQLSERAQAVHKPGEAFRNMGFDPEF